LYELSTAVLKLQVMTRAEGYLLRMVSIPGSDSPLNALLTRENVEEMNVQTVETIARVRREITELRGKIALYQGL
jgi:hypothetical protein